MLHAPTVGLWTCLRHKNVLMQLVTPRLLTVKLIIVKRGLSKATLRDVTYWVRETWFSIHIPPEEGNPQPLAFARKVIRNFECINQN